MNNNSFVRCPQTFISPEHGLDISRLFDTVSYKIKFNNENPDFFKPCGTLIFTGSQGTGKTLSAVDYTINVLNRFPKCILVTNTDIVGYPPNAYLFPVKHTKSEWLELFKNVMLERQAAFENDLIDKFKLHYKYDITAKLTEDEYVARNMILYPYNPSSDFDIFVSESSWQLRSLYDDHIITSDSINSGSDERIVLEYWGLDTLKYVNNGKFGVLFFIDEIHLELNSLESKNIDIDIITEISQQRKQRKHIVGTSQRYMRMAKPLREQVRDIVICKNYFGCLQFNKFIDGDGTVEKDGKLECEVRSRHLFWHSPIMYLRYDTFAKMRRYNNEWKGRPRDPLLNNEVSINVSTN